ncbi:DNA methyltransferase [Polaribacter phage P12002L]|uniref:DNA methyltransferase n=1 Tax=Polaribacter phage P12002L TaxID=1647386 RepID=A0A0F7ILF2_9CAUD|nr:DNA methyltransferase [Polaribacter phage P12002L]AKG94209.1 DNA methyltransferase [Polaribacter phage P12002L]
MIDLRLGDCLEVMKTIEDKSIDAIICDLPYGTTDCKWDSIIQFDKLWPQYERIIKDNGAIVLFGAEPFSSLLRCSNLNIYKYDWIWDKVNKKVGYGNAKRQPLRGVENISVFYKKQCTYNPIMGVGKPYKSKSGGNTKIYEKGGLKSIVTDNKGTRYPHSIISIKGDLKKEMGLHPTQKPVELLEYLIKTYTNDGETVLDNTMGSGSTGVACKQTNRKFIGIEREEKYFKIAQERINSTLF